MGWLGLIVITVLGILGAVSPRYRPVPPDDPSVYLYVGQTILHGGTPYRDAWDHKQPLALTPHSVWGMWLIEFVALAAAGVLPHPTVPDHPFRAELHLLLYSPGAAADVGIGPDRGDTQPGSG